MKIEMHAHTGESSPCAHVSARQMVSLYRDAGYDAVVVTDHYCKWVYEQSGADSLEQYTDYFLSGYRAAKKAAVDTSMTILLGIEVNLTESPNDYLLYGITEDFVQKHPKLFTLSLKELSELCRNNHILLFQAHPYRTYCSPGNPDYLDGAEWYNGNPRHNNQNDLASRWAAAHRLLSSSGSDFHEVEDLAKGGIQTDRQVTNITELCQLLLDGDYQLLMPEA